MDDKKKLILSILGSLALVLVLGVIIYFLFFYDFTYQDPDRDAKEDAPRESLEDPSDRVQEDPTPDLDPDPDREIDEDEIRYSQDDHSFRDKTEFDENDIKKLARLFAERFGSYSSHSGFDNIKDLRGLMSDEMRDWADDFLEERIDEEEEYDYYGVSTRALVSRVEEFDESAGQAKVFLDTQRNERKDNQENTFSQAIEISLIKKGDTWKVDSAYWQ